MLLQYPCQFYHSSYINHKAYPYKKQTPKTISTSRQKVIMPQYPPQIIILSLNNLNVPSVQVIFYYKFVLTQKSSNLCALQDFSALCPILPLGQSPYFFESCQYRQFLQHLLIVERSVLSLFAIY